MTDKLKKDLRTIAEVLTLSLIYFSWNSFSSGNPLIGDAFFGLWILFWIYNLYEKFQYKKGNRPDTIRFATLNDDYSKMTSITLGIMVFAGALIGFFAFDIALPYFIIAATVGLIVFLNGLFDLPKGWIEIGDHSLKIFGIQKAIDLRQLKEIELKNDQIVLTNIYGEHKNSNLLKLDVAIASDIKNFLTEKLHSQVSVINNTY